MVDEQNSVPDDDINDYVDGRMDEVRAAAFERVLSTDPEIAARVFAYKSLNDGISGLYDPVMQEPVPDKLRDVLEAKPRRRWGATLLRAASYFFVLLAGIGGGWWGQDRLTSDDYLLKPVVRQALLTYDLARERTKIDATLAGTVEDEIPIGFLPASSSIPARLPTLRRWEFRPVAISSSAGTTGSTINVTYRDKKDEIVTLHVQQLDKRLEIPVVFAEGEKHPTLYWIDGSLVYVLVSDKSKDELVAIARDIYSARALSKRPAISPAKQAN